MVISISEKKGFASSDICEPPTLTVIAYKELEWSTLLKMCYRIDNNNDLVVVGVRIVAPPKINFEVKPISFLPLLGRMNHLAHWGFEIRQGRLITDNGNCRNGRQEGFVNSLSEPVFSPSYPSTHWPTYSLCVSLLFNEKPASFNKHLGDATWNSGDAVSPLRRSFICRAWNKLKINGNTGWIRAGD